MNSDHGFLSSTVGRKPQWLSSSPSLFVDCFCCYFLKLGIKLPVCNAWNSLFFAHFPGSNDILLNHLLSPRKNTVADITEQSPSTNTPTKKGERNASSNTKRLSNSRININILSNVRSHIVHLEINKGNILFNIVNVLL